MQITITVTEDDVINRMRSDSHRIAEYDVRSAYPSAIAEAKYPEPEPSKTTRAPRKRKRTTKPRK